MPENYRFLPHMIVVTGCILTYLGDWKLLMRSRTGWRRHAGPQASLKWLHALTTATGFMHHYKIKDRGWTTELRWGLLYCSRFVLSARLPGFTSPNLWLAKRDLKKPFYLKWLQKHEGELTLKFSLHFMVLCYETTEYHSISRQEQRNTLSYIYHNTQGRRHGQCSNTGHNMEGHLEGQDIGKENWYLDLNDNYAV